MRKRGILFVAALLSIFSVADAEEIRYDKERVRDPFVPLLGGEAQGGGGQGLEVEGIIFDPRGTSYAVIGGEVYQEGETVGGAQVMKIFADRVIFFQRGEEMVTWLREEIVKKEEDEPWDSTANIPQAPGGMRTGGGNL